MNKRRFIAGERHHWWPQSVSRFWADDDNLIGRIDTNGKVTRSTPTNTARIGDGHNIRLGADWNITFEQEFDRADGEFPRMVKMIRGWISSLAEPGTSTQEFRSHKAPDDDLETLCSCLLSLVCRSPCFRAQIKAFVNGLRTNVQKSELNVLIPINMQTAYLNLRRNISGSGKFVVLYSREDSGTKEFIFGDGFYNNLNIFATDLFHTRMLLPITPRTAVLYARPNQCFVEPKLFSLELDNKLVALVNETTQVYSKDCLFFRAGQPELTNHFLQRQHQRFDRWDPIKEIVEDIPGVIQVL